MLLTILFWLAVMPLIIYLAMVLLLVVIVDLFKNL